MNSELESVIQEFFLDEGYTPMGVGSPMPDDYYERFKDIYPEGLFYAWRRFGFDGFGRGKVWLTDPVEWQPVVDAWMGSIQFPFEDEWTCIMRSACGNLKLWGKRTGLSVNIDPRFALIFPINDGRTREEIKKSGLLQRYFFVLQTMGRTKITSQCLRLLCLTLGNSRPAQCMGSYQH